MLFTHGDTEALDRECDLAMVSNTPAGPGALGETQSLLPGHDPSSPSALPQGALFTSDFAQIQGLFGLGPQALMTKVE